MSFPFPYLLCVMYSFLNFTPTPCNGSSYSLFYYISDSFAGEIWLFQTDMFYVSRFSFLGKIDFPGRIKVSSVIIRPENRYSVWDRMFVWLFEMGSRNKVRGGGAIIKLFRISPDGRWAGSFHSIDVKESFRGDISRTVLEPIGNRNHTHIWTQDDSNWSSVEECEWSGEFGKPNNTKERKKVGEEN